MIVAEPNSWRVIWTTSVESRRLQSVGRYETCVRVTDEEYRPPLDEASRYPPFWTLMVYLIRQMLMRFGYEQEAHGFVNAAPGSGMS